MIFEKLKAKWEEYLERKLNERENAYWWAQPVVNKVTNAWYKNQTLSAIETLYEGCTFIDTTFTHLIRVDFDNCMFIGKCAFPNDSRAVSVNRSIFSPYKEDVNNQNI